MQGRHLDTFSRVGWALVAVLLHMHLNTIEENEHDHLRTWGQGGDPLISDAAVNFEAVIFLFILAYLM